MKTTKSIQEWQQEVHELAREKGWWPELVGDAHGPGKLSASDIGTKIALIHSEISEAYREKPGHGVAYTKEMKPVGFAVEIADTVIRILDLCTAVGVQLGNDWTKVVGCDSVSDGILMAHDTVSKALECVRAGSLWHCFSDEMTDAIGICLCIAEIVGFDPWEVVAIKHAYNKTRPFRHGGKAL